MSKFINYNKVPDQTGILSSLKSFKFTPNVIIGIVVLILFIAISIYCYKKFVSPLMATSYKANREPTDGSSAKKTAELMLFYVDWCPHCKTAKPIWEELKTEYQDKTINGYKIIFTDINCTNESPDIESMMNKYKIEGFPTIKLLKDGQVIEYDAKPSKATLEQFLNTVL
jgi:thiol-disulfide isomerase/thioredoxin